MRPARVITVLGLLSMVVGTVFLVTSHVDTTHMTYAQQARVVDSGGTQAGGWLLFLGVLLLAVAFVVWYVGVLRDAARRIRAKAPKAAKGVATAWDLHQQAKGTSMMKGMIAHYAIVQAAQRQQQNRR